VAEVLLQRTRAEMARTTVVEFIKLWPNAARLADAKVPRVKSILASIGLQNNRAARLRRLAKIILSEFGGEVPLDAISLMKLPGVGRYTANAVLVLTRDERLPLLDENVVRVYSRVFTLTTSRTRARNDPAAWAFAKAALPKAHKDFSLAILDLGRRICLPRRPRCPVCPLADECEYRRTVDAPVIRGDRAMEPRRSGGEEFDPV
jgi:A/G-specific adenine glycosylase